MLPSKNKSNERQAARQRKASARQVASGGAGASAYNPSSGTFHLLEPLMSDTGVGYVNGRTKSIDDVDDNANSNGGGAADTECMSNNGSYSGESEDQLRKEKHGPVKSGTSGTDNKRDKIRGKNERKHQRQKERRAQELRDKCTSYLMSRKLEALAQKLVVMGFSQERATMALIVNDGHVERSVAWLLEGGGEGQVHEDCSNPKIDISEELSQISEIENKYKFSRPDIERAVVSCEGDISKALKLLRAGDGRTSPICEEGQEGQGGLFVRSMKEETMASLPSMSHGPIAMQVPRGSVPLQSSYQSRKNERITILSCEERLHAGPSNTFVSLEHRNSPTELRQQSNSLTDRHLLVEKNGYTQGTRPSPVSVKTVPYASISEGKTDLIFGFGAPDLRLFSGPAQEFVQDALGQTQMLTRAIAQPIVRPKNDPVSSPAISPSSWSHGFMEGGSPSSVLHVNATLGDMGLIGLNTGKKAMEPLDLGASGTRGLFNPFLSEAQCDGVWKRLSNAISSAPSPHSATHSRSSSGTSYGLFTGWGAHSSVDWSTGPISNCDYRNIDWSMNASSTRIQGVSSQLNSLMLQKRGWNPKGEKTSGYGIWKVDSAGHGVQDNFSIDKGNSATHEWTSPFAGKDLFNLPQTVPSPSM